tara:strand:- start:1773 stop:2006 length:234 start_codon:yes stop_codon:yes gene_type:complete
MIKLEIGKFYKNPPMLSFLFKVINIKETDGADICRQGDKKILLLFSNGKRYWYYESVLRSHGIKTALEDEFLLETIK